MLGQSTPATDAGPDTVERRQVRFQSQPTKCLEYVRTSQHEKDDSVVEKRKEDAKKKVTAPSKKFAEKECKIQPDNIMVRMTQLHRLLTRSLIIMFRCVEMSTRVCCSSWPP